MGMSLGPSLSIVSHILAGGAGGPPSLFGDMVFLNDQAPTFVNASANRYNPYNNTFAGANVRRRRPLAITGTTTRQLDLVEGTRTNLCLYSSEFDNVTAWSTDGATLPFNVVAAPDGTVTAEKLAEAATLGNHWARQAIISALGEMTFSVYAKAAERSLLTLSISDFASGDAVADFNLSAGTLSGVGAGGAWTNTSATISPAGNGWFRCTITSTRGAGTGSYPTLYMNDGSGLNYQGVLGNGLYLWGAQLEQGVPFASTYMPTGAAATVRAQDNLVSSLVGLAGGGLSATAGTIIAVGVPEGRALPAGTYDLTDTANSQLAMRIIAGSSVFTRSASLGTVETETNRTLKSYSLTWDATRLRYYRNGAAANDVAPGSPAVVPSVPIGALASGGNDYYGFVGLLYWPRVLTPAEILSVHNALSLP